MISLRKLAEQQKEHRALKLKNRILKQTHDKKLAEPLSPITKNLDTINKPTKKLGDILIESSSETEKNRDIVLVEFESEDKKIQTNLRALPNSSVFSESMAKTLGGLMSSPNSLQIKPSSSGATILGVPIYTPGGDQLRIRDNVYDFTPEVYENLSFTGYTGNTVKNESDMLMMNNNVRDLGYTGVGDKKSNKKTFLTIPLPKLIEKTQNKTFDEITDDSDDLQGEVVKIIIPSNINYIYTRLEISLGLKLSGRTVTLTEASNLIDDIYKLGEIQNEQQYRNTLNKLST